MITIKTIAKMAGVSHTTVSRALNGDPAVKNDTKKKIQKIALEVGYSPNLRAKGLVTNKNYTIGLFFSSIEVGTSYTFLTEMIQRLYDQLDQEYMLTVNGIDELVNYDKAVKARLDGVIVISQSSKDDEFINFVNSNKIPLLVMNRLITQKGVANVAFDEYMGALQLTEYAIKMGHKKFGIIEGLQEFKSSTLRKKAFMDSIQKAGLTVVPEAIIQGDYQAPSGYQAMKRILLSSEVPDFVFCGNDDMTIGAIKACDELNVRVPEDISLIGFDDSMYAKYINPGLTTVRKPIDQITEVGLQVFDQILNNPEYEVGQEIIPPELIIRNTVKDLTKE